MNSSEFLRAVGRASEFIVDYYGTVSSRPVLPDVRPGFLLGQLGKQCPAEGVDFESIFREFQEKIMPGITHWASPHFHAYFTAGNCFASMIAELLMAGINNIGINWEASPALGELEVIVLNWLGKMMDLPEAFLDCSEGPGGGVFQTTSTECTLLSFLAARRRTVQRCLLGRPYLSEWDILPNVVIYTSVQSHASVERVGLMCRTRTRLLACNQEGKITPQTFRQAVEEDHTSGLHPCFLVATMGATSTCSWDDLSALGRICRDCHVWMHVDAAYAGAALVCPELRYIGIGLHLADSFSVALHKWLLMSYDVVAMWLKDTSALADVLSVSRIYLTHKHAGHATDFIDLQIASGRKFRALKVWMVLRSVGVRGVQEHIRRHVMLAMYMEQLMGADDRFQVIAGGLGLVVFALRAGNYATEKLHTAINERKRLLLTPAHFNGKYVIRFVVNFTTRAEHVEYAWDEIRRTANHLADTRVSKDCLDLLTSQKVRNLNDELEISHETYHNGQMDFLCNVLI